MFFVCASRRFAVVCIVIVILLASSLANGSAAPVAHPRGARTVMADVKTSFDSTVRGRYTSTPMMLRAQSEERLMAFPPAKSAASRPLTVIYLHGAHGRVENGCPWFRSGASELGWLVCPEAIEPQPDGSWSWGADVFEQAPVVARALHAAREQGATEEPGVAVGFSQGSYVALDLVKARLARFRGLVLLGAEMHPNAKTLRDAGVRRVALGAGSLDGAHASLVEEATRLSGEGLETRFFDLGRIGHAYTVEDTAILRDAIVWAGGIDG
jgi:pimeloyl-ACP methyl ester carboxylesterase